MRAALNSNDLVALKAVQMGDAALRTIPEATLRSNGVPILAVVGELDWARPDAERMVDVVSNSTIEIIPGATHVTGVTHPQFLAAVMRFLASR
jgi:pimeloyl-ACP methyl ester carboxylesterase